MDKRREKEYNTTRSVFSRGRICHAPTININFDQSGIASACCYNRQHILGKYPENSLMEMWQGERANQLRAYIKEGDLSHGCQLCEKQIDSGNYHGVRARHFDNYERQPKQILNRLLGREGSRPMPQCFEFELDNTCNLECTMCNGHFSSSIRKNRENLPELKSPYDDEFVQQLIPFIPYLKDAKFLGGEPFLIPIYQKIWEAMAQYNPDIRIHITTNGTVFNNKVESVLEKLSCVIIVSIDSIEKDTYESIRKNANFERVMTNVDRFRSYARSTNNWFSFAVCPMITNWQELPDLVRYCNDNGTVVGFNTVLDPEELSLRSLSLEQLNRIVVFYESQKFAGSGFIFRMNKKVFADLTNQLRAWAQEKTPS